MPTPMRFGRAVAPPSLLLLVGVLLAACSSKERAAPVPAAESQAAKVQAAPGPLGEGGAAAPPFDISGVIQQVRFSSRAEGEGFAGGHGTYAVDVVGGRVKLRPFHRRGARAESERADRLSRPPRRQVRGRARRSRARPWIWRR